MKKPIDRNNIENFELMRKPLDEEDALVEADRCLLCEDAPCSKGCPVGTDPAKFIRQIKFSNFKGAARTIRNNNPLGSICSIICPHEKLCEKNCSISALEDPINIGGLQQFAANYGKERGLEPLSADKSREHVAVIGGGPAGIGCATELAKMGYNVTLFEKEAACGGIAKWLIPHYRLSDEMLDYDLKNLSDLGINIEYNANTDTKEKVLALLNDKFKAVFIATGLSTPVELPMYKNYTNVYNFVQFLRQAKCNQQQLNIKGKNVAVIGGGSVAMDVACVSAALGAQKIYAISLEGLAELPADKEEIELAHMMHVNFQSSSQVTEVLSENSVITGLKGKEIEWIEPNNFTPGNAKLVDGTGFKFKVDLVIQAIGAKPNAELTQINHPGLFYGGDVANGGATVVQAISEGKNAALTINEFLSKGGN